MLNLAHHEAGPCLTMLVTLLGPAILALRCWLWERQHQQDDDGEHRH